MSALVVACGGAAPAPIAPTEGAPPSVSTAPDPSEAPAIPVSADVAKGVQALEANDPAGAKAHFEAALKANAGDADAFYYLGVLSEKTGDQAGAEASYKRALDARPGFLGAEVNATALLDDAQRWDEALALTTTSLQQHPKDGALHLNAAIAYGGKKDATSAVREFELAIARQPRDATYRLVYGHWLSVLGRRDDALVQLQAGIPLARTNVGVVAAIGHELHVMKAFPECTSVFSQAIALKDAAELWTERASCRIGQNDDAGALGDLHAATQKDATYAPAQYYLGNELAKTGDFAGAITAYQAFLKLEPNGPLAKGVLEKIRIAKQRLKP